MLKALILSVVPRAQEEAILAMFRGVQAHDYDWLMRLYKENGGAEMPRHLVSHFARVYTWSTNMRYSPATIQARRAKAFLDSTTDIMKWADGRL